MLSVLTAFAIQNNNCSLDVFKINDNLFGFLIYADYPNRHGETPILVSSKPVFNSKKEALKAGEFLLQNIKTTKIFSEKGESK